MDHLRDIFGGVELTENETIGMGTCELDHTAIDAQQIDGDPYIGSWNKPHIVLDLDKLTAIAHRL